MPQQDECCGDACHSYSALEHGIVLQGVCREPAATTAHEPAQRQETGENPRKRPSSTRSCFRGRSDSWVQITSKPRLALPEKKNVAAKTAAPEGSKGLWPVRRSISDCSGHRCFQAPPSRHLDGPYPA